MDNLAEDSWVPQQSCAHNNCHLMNEGPQKAVLYEDEVPHLLSQRQKNWLLGMTSGTRMWGTGWKKIQHYICIRNKRIVQASRVFVENHDGSEQPPRLLHLNNREKKQIEDQNNSERGA